MESMQKVLVVIGFAVVVGLTGLGACELYNKLMLGEHLRPTIQPIQSDLEE